MLFQIDNINTNNRPKMYAIQHVQKIYARFFNKVHKKQVFFYVAWTGLSC